ncbi:MAG TPA: SDR family NAD(P)-dependent oxidoreductase [Steroidobacteraceae bacterium]|nr:SDR family NAD(P)-dependent oxidoreductase [Steroidobacteraceae bacterium]
MNAPAGAAGNTAPAGAGGDEFHGVHVLVTGASTGIGLATAKLLARRGAKVFLVARGTAKLADAADSIARAGGTARYEAADVSDRKALLAAMDQAEETFGAIEGLFANAGTGGSFAPFGSYDESVFETVMRTNLSSVFWAIKRVLPGMIERKRGSIVVTGSLASERGMPNNAAYVASKHGVLGLARAAAAEAAPHNVRVNCVLPGLIETPMLMQLDPHAARESIRAMLGKSVPMGRIGTADELAELACFLLSERASHITAQSIAVDGGVLGTHSPR